MSRVLKVDSPRSLTKGIDEAVGVISDGGIVAFPTESFYGLGGDATNPDAVRKIFAIKKRAADVPILMLVASLQELEKYVLSIPLGARKMGEKFWPGGLTMIFHASVLLPSLLTAGTGKVAIRISSHPLANALIRSLTVPLTGTSANISGSPPCTRADQVVECLGDDVNLILDGGATEGINPSTMLDVTVDPPQLIREGRITVEEILASGIYETIARPN